MHANRSWIDSRRSAAAALGLALPLALAVSAPAQTNIEALRQRDLELDAARTEQRKTAESERRLKLEIDTIGDDRRKLNRALLDAAAKLRAAEDRVSAAEARIKPLDEAERGIRRSLDGRRATMAEVLAALQRLGRQPPPALVIRPEDALQAVRTAMLLGAVLPEMRIQAEALVSDLSDLARVRREIADEQDRLRRDADALQDERRRLARLIEERQKTQAETEAALDAERQKAKALAQQVDDLKDLIGKMEQGLDRAARAARAAQRAADEQAKAGRVDLAAINDPGRLTPAVQFATTRGTLPLPVNGVRIREFGAPDSLGGTEKGLTVSTRAGAQVTSPCDGWVVYAGVFRNYGQVLILNAGGGYHIVLAGMDRISVDVGQFVLAGEPVAIMGSGSQAASLALGSSQPVLYIEFRKDGTPVDPSPWWAASEGEKVRG
jgi:septal ring factor EnvC (AmiA/AmiB activator)